MDINKIKTELTLVETDRNKYGYVVIADHAYITFKNFAGVEDPIYNKNGNRTFSLCFTNPEVATQLQNDGWYVSMVTPKHEGDDLYYKIKVIVSNFAIDKGKIKRYINGNEFVVDEDTVKELDSDYIEDVKLVISPSDNKFQPGKICAYVQEMKVWVKPEESFI